MILTLGICGAALFASAWYMLRGAFDVELFGGIEFLLRWAILGPIYLVGILPARGIRNVVRRLRRTRAHLAPRALPAPLPMGMPDLRGLPEELAKQYTGLTMLWGRANRIAVEVEERYHLERIATVNIPEGWASYNRLLVDQAHVAQAQQLFGRQLELLTDQVTQIIDRRAGDMLTQMRSQVVALRSWHTVPAGHLQLVPLPLAQRQGD